MDMALFSVYASTIDTASVKAPAALRPTIFGLRHVHNNGRFSFHLPRSSLQQGPSEVLNSLAAVCDLYLHHLFAAVALVTLSVRAHRRFQGGLLHLIRSCQRGVIVGTNVRTRI